MTTIYLYSYFVDISVAKLKNQVPKDQAVQHFEVHTTTSKKEWVEYTHMEILLFEEYDWSRMLSYEVLNIYASIHIYF